MPSTSVRSVSVSVSTATKRVVVGFFLGHVEQFARVLQACFEAPQVLYDLIKALLFAAQFLGSLGVVPDLGILERLLDFD